MRVPQRAVSAEASAASGEELHGGLGPRSELGRACPERVADAPGPAAFHGDGRSGLQNGPGAREAAALGVKSWVLCAAGGSDFWTRPERVH